MSTMALQMPCSYVDIDRDEMEYVDGGIYISNSDLRTFCKATFVAVGINPVGATLIGLGVWKVAAIITAGWAAISAKLGAWSGPIGWVLGIVVLFLKEMGNICEKMECIYCNFVDFKYK